MGEKDTRIDRRDFLKSTTSTAAAAAGFMIVRPEAVRGTAANSAVQLGIIGCGGRGTSVASSMMENTNLRVVAIADVFQDRLDAGNQRFSELAREKNFSKISRRQLFRGSNGYQRLAESRHVDAVLVSSPSYLHPDHLEAVVAAGKHAYCEKPVGVDVYGCKRVVRIGERAQGKTTLHVGFQIRNAPPFVEMVKRIHAGALGEIVCGQAYYYSGALRVRPTDGLSADAARIRNWMHDRELSGDIIVEQNIHAIDICNWVLQSHPVKATASGGRKVSTRPGNTWDHFNATFLYPNDVHVSFASTQFIKGWGQVTERFFGARGACESHYSHPVAIYGEEAWNAGLGPDQMSEEERKEAVRTGEFPGALEHADSEKQKAFVASITEGGNDNQAVQGAESALTAILARTAAYKGEEVTWDELINSNDRWDPMVNTDALG